jgi:hypothetical protein
MRRSIAALAALAAAVLACEDAGEPAAVACENASHVEIPSPDARLGAWVFVRHCGDASSVQVSILPADSMPPAEAGNAFAVSPVVEVTVAWPGDHRLRITHGAGEVSKQEYQVAGVTVSYEAR